MEGDLSAHWQNILRQSLPILVLALFISTASGVILGSNEGKLLMIPALALLIPPFINMGGDTSSILGSRLGSALHLGTIKPFELNEDLLEDVAATLILGILSFTFLGFATYVMSIIINMPIALTTILSITIIAGTISSVVMVGLAVVSAFISYSHGLDPDNIVTPLMSTGGDIVGVLSLFMTIKLLGI
jgi:mgtE-like transporter